MTSIDTAELSEWVEDVDPLGVLGAVLAATDEDDPTPDTPWAWDLMATGGAVVQAVSLAIAHASGVEHVDPPGKIGDPSDTLRACGVAGELVDRVTAAWDARQVTVLNMEIPAVDVAEQYVHDCERLVADLLEGAASS